MEIEHLRREYLHGGLRREDLLGDPIAQFELWLDQAIKMGINDPTAMSVATVAPDGQPSQRDTERARRRETFAKDEGPSQRGEETTIRLC